MTITKNLNKYGLLENLEIQWKKKKNTNYKYTSNNIF
jgi:hypothetical protein